MRKRLMILALVLIAVLMTCTLAACSSGGGRCSGGHTWDEGTVKEAATCLESGTLINKCTVCGIKREVAIETLGHDLQTIPGTVIEPTCEVDGYAGKKACVREGCEHVLDTGTIIPAIGHAYGDWTSNGDGTHKRVCSNDSNHVESGKCSGGTADCGHKAVCDVCGGEYGDFASSHVFDKQVTTDAYKATDATCETKATYYYSCQCGEKGTETFEYGDYADHVFDREEAEAEYLVSVATCTTKATYYYSCECGEKGTTTFESGATLDHTMTYHAAVDATCISKGNVEYWTCSTCSLNYDSATGGNVINDVTTAIDSTNHVHRETTAPAVDPSCENTGLTAEISCADCGIVLQEREEIPALGHKGGTATCKDKAVCEVCGEAYGELANHTPGEIKEENNVAPSCTAEGSYDNVIYCSVCDLELSRETITTDKVAHTGGTATCVEKATCSVCGEKYGDLADHSWDEGVVTTPATCTTEGVKTFTCTVDGCGETRTETIAKSAHNFVDNVCEDCQATVSYVDKAIVFTFGENGNAEHKDGSSDKATYTETKDGYTLSISGGSKMYPGSFDAKGNSALKLGTGSVAGSFEFTVPADVTQVIIYVAGYKDNTAKITVNGDAYTITTKSNDGAYTEIKVDTTVNKKVSFTTVSGSYRCMINTIEFKVSAENIFNHENREIVEVVAPTCTVEGHTTYVCPDCGHTFDADFVDATGHTLVSIPAVAPTCESTGLTEGEKCSVCGQVTVERTIVDMLPCVDVDNDEYCDNCHKPMCEHVYGAWTYVNADTHNHVCTLCGKEEIAVHDYKVTSHVDATCEEVGSTTYACADCGHEYTETHVALGHNEITHDAQAPTCSAVGWEAYVTCSRCDYTTYDELPIDADAHKWDEGEVQTPATCTEAGERLHTCEHNAEHTKVEVIPATGHTPVKNVCDCGYEYSVNEIIALAEALAKDTALKGTYRLTGVIKSVDTEFSTQFNNVTVTITVDGTEKDLTIQCFRMNGEGADKIGVGDTITVSGEIKRYGTTLEFDSGCALESCIPAEFEVYLEVFGKGTVSGIPAGTLARGDEVTFTVTPDTANKYEIDRVTINGSTLNGTDGVYTFIISSKTTVNVSFKKEGQESSTTKASVSTKIGDYASANNWANQTKYTSITMDGNVSATVKGGTNTGKYYTSGLDWRIYQTEDPTLTITGGANVTILTVKVTYAVEKGGCLTYNDNIASGTVVEVNASSIVFGLGNTGSATNGQVRVTSIEVSYQVESTNGSACAHENWSDYVVTTPATCTERGVETATCLNAECGETKTRQIPVDPTRHVYNETITTPATCTQPGLKTLTCECGDTKTEEIAATGHNYNSVVTAPTCTTGGHTTHTCSVCGDTYKDSETSATGHTEVIDEAVEATCTTAGKTEGKHCSVCGEVIVAQEEVKALGHDEITHEAKAPTCTEKGWDAYVTCSRCDYSTYVEKAAAGHKYDSVVTDPTCEADGYTTYTCSVCKHSYIADTTNKLGHDYVSTVTKDPTCTETGVRTYVCTHDNSHTYTEEIAKLSHTPAAAVEENRVEATCTQEGSYDSVVKCSVCGEELSRDTKTINKVAHSSVEIPAVAPTCTEKGKTAGAKCSVCGEILTAQTDVDELGHKAETVAGKNATCTETGLIDGSKCSVCGEILTAQKVVNALGHEWEWVIDTPATVTSTGLKHEECTRCDATQSHNTIIEILICVHTDTLVHHAKVDADCENAGSIEYWHCTACEKNFSDKNGQIAVENITIPATGHNYNSVVTTPTCTADGYTTHTCANCRDSYVDTYVDALGHTGGTATCTEKATCTVCGEAYGEFAAHTEVIDAAIAATCTATGLTEGKHCSVCGKVLVEQEVTNALGHDFAAGEVVAPKCEEQGYTIFDCSRCDATENRNYADALDHSWVETSRTEATCVATGAINFVCEHDNSHTKTETIAINSNAHDLVEHDAKAPTCTEIGWDAYEECSRCDHTTYEAKIALGHDEVEHNAKAPTCSEIGWDAYVTCTRCDHTTYAEKSALGHDEIPHEAQAPTCTEIGWDAYVTCSRCDYTTKVELEALGHEMTRHAEKDSTCTEEGNIEYWSCSTCGKNYQDEVGTIVVEDVITSKAEHNYVDGMCTVCAASYITKTGTFEFGENGEPGHKDGSDVAGNWEMTDNNVSITLSDMIKVNNEAYDATGKSCLKLGTSSATASFTLTVPSEVTSVSIYVAGYKANMASVVVNGVTHAIETLSNNGEYTEIVVNTKDKKVITFATNKSPDERCMIDKIVVEYVTECEHIGRIKGDVVKPTCTERGYTIYSCPDCDTSFNWEYVDSLDHNYKSTVTAPTCTVDGYTTHTCANCGDSYTDSTVKANGHVDKDDNNECDVCGVTICQHTSFNEWVVVTPATCTQTGEKTRKCTNCDYVETETIAALGHDFGELIAKVDATCLNEGKKAHYECSRCHGLFDENKNATTEAELIIGLAEHNLVDNVCSVCKWTFIDETIDLDETYEKGVVPSKHDGKNVTLAFNKNDGQYTPQADNSYFKLYAKNSMIISAVEGKITKVIITYSGSYTGTFSLEGYSLNDSTGTWIGVADRIEFTNSSSSQARIASIQIITEYYVCEHVPTGDAIEVKAATCTEDGYEKYMCEKCSQVYVETVLKAAGHSYVDQVTAPTCTAKGYTTHTCSTCGHNYKDTEVDMIDHTYVDGVCSCGAEDPSAGGGSTETPEPTEVTAELSFASTEQRTAFDTLHQVWEQNGIVLTNNKGSSTSNVADYAGPARFYKNSTITVEAPGKITTIVFHCNSAEYATALKNSITDATVSVKSDKVTVTLDGNSNTFTIKSLSGGRVFMDSVTVTYVA